jgi:flavin reductase (DIM6/NTAB) family NADH-FMN oxidoreductase RutF
MKIDPKKTDKIKLQAFMADSIAPRPIALASTIDEKGTPNLSPFSFFNAFGTNPPVLVFSPSRRNRDNTTKHTFENLKKHKEVVINTVSYDMLHQINLASSEFGDGIDEFIKSGLTPVKADKVKPFIVKESPVSFECKVLDIIETGKEGGAGNLIVCEIVMMHVQNNILKNKTEIDHQKIDLIGRLGKNLYVRTNDNNVFAVDKPGSELAIGFDALPPSVRKSKVLTGNEIAQMAMLPSLPSKDEIKATKQWQEVEEIFEISDIKIRREKIHKIAGFLIKRGKIKEALQLVLTVK